MFDLTTLEIFLITFAYFHIAGTSYTIYVHRGLHHRTVEYHPWLQKIFQTALWMTIGSWDRTVLGYHLVHHKYADNPRYDPQSPTATSRFYVMCIKPIRIMFKHILFKKVFPIIPAKYIETDRSKLKTDELFLLDEANTLIHKEPLGYEWYLEHSRLGPLLFLLFNLLMFGWVGLLIVVLVQFSVAVSLVTVSDGILHAYGYRHFDTKDNSTNLVPWGIIFSGEELHNNHHARPWSANFAYKWYEFDIGYFYIRIFKILGLAKTS